MARYIDADALKTIKSIQKADFNSIKTIQEWIDDAPTADVRENVNGKWIRENIVLTSNPPQYQWHCSECGRLVHWFSTEMLTDFCPNCGAWMKGEEDGRLNFKTGCD